MNAFRVHAVDGWLLYIRPYGLLPAGDICSVFHWCRPKGSWDFLIGVVITLQAGGSGVWFSAGRNSSLKKISSLNVGPTTLASPGLKWLERDCNPLPPYCARFHDVDSGNFTVFILIVGHESRLTSPKICATAPAQSWIFSHVQYCYNFLKMAQIYLPSTGLVFITSSRYVSLKICDIYVHNTVEWQTHLHCMRRKNYSFSLHTVG